MMSRLRRLLGRFLVLIFASTCAPASSSAQSKAPQFLPLAQITTTLARAEFDGFIDQLDQFTEEEGFVLQTRPPLGSRNLNCVIRLGENTFFYVDNRLTATIVHVIAYSQNAGIDWRSPWQRLADRLRASFGTQRVIVQTCDGKTCR